ncbi:MAG: esterase [Anaerolineae bacterium]|nr:esterase [Anaerolineae bacterium]
MKHLITTLGPKTADELGMILPHEHIFVDLRTPDQPGQGEADPQDVIRLMAPEIERARAVGVTALIECSPEGVGRRADILKAVSGATGFPLIVPTGIYREPWVPAWAHKASKDTLYEWMLGELTNEIDDSGVQAAWIKLSAGDDGLTAIETKILRAAARAAAETNAIIGSHTRRGRVVNDQLDIIEDAGYTPERFIWIHAQNDPDMNLEIAARGAWIEFDAIGDPQRDPFWIERVQTMLDAGYGDKVMLSHDRGWYDPAQPGGGTPRPFTYISEQFLPKLLDAGIDQKTVDQLTVTNPFNAFAR